MGKFMDVPGVLKFPFMQDFEALAYPLQDE